jgi:hypothetical protein
MLTLLALLLAAATDDPRPTVTAAPAQGVTLDGVLDEAAWDGAEVATGFVQFEPDEGAPASTPTEVRVLRTPGALVVGARLAADGVEVREALSRRDSDGGADAFIVALDSYNDGRTAYLFGVTAAGVQFDALLEGDDQDRSWDAVWESAVRVGPDGWSVELRVPYSQLRFAEGVASWGVNFQRVVPALGEESFWSPVTRAEARGGLVQLFGRLDGLAGIEPRPVLQVLPYSLAGASRSEDEGAPGTGVADGEANVGADLKVGLSSNVTLDATVNPDFGQVEADPAELNLSTFETAFRERRPFFVEGTQIFDLGFSGGDGRFLYTRRIGADAPIIAAAKVTGRTPGGLAFGALGAATGSRFSPGRAYGAARVRQEFAGQSYVGGGLTGFGQRERPGDDVEGAASVAAAGDWALRFADGTWQFEGTTAATLRQHGGERDLGAAAYVGLDKVEGFVLPGFGVRAYTPGFRLNDLGLFRQTDLVRAVAGARWLVNENRPVGPFRRLQLGAFPSVTWTYETRDFRGLDAFTFARADFFGFQSARLFVEVEDLGGLDVRETRGLGPVRNVPTLGAFLSVESDSRRELRLELDLGGSVGEDGGRSGRVGAELDWTVSDRVRLDLEVGVSRADGERAWAANEPLFRTDDGLFFAAEADAPEAVDGGGLVPYAAAPGLLDGLAPYADAPLLVDGATAYYVPLFGARDTRRADLTARGQVVFGPGLSLQLFGQLFAARGRFRDFAFLAGPDDLRPAGDFPKRRDFSFASFTGNAVLRWEYRPASTLFVVWSHGREDERFEETVLGPDAGPSPFATGTARHLSDPFEAFPRDVLLVKLSYLLMR